MILLGWVLAGQVFFLGAAARKSKKLQLGRENSLKNSFAMKKRLRNYLQCTKPLLLDPKARGGHVLKYCRLKKKKKKSKWAAGEASLYRLWVGLPITCCHPPKSFGGRIFFKGKRSIDPQ